MQKLTRLERRYLSRRICWLCDQRLDRTVCLAFHEPRCTREQMHERRLKCLEHYRPRQRRTA
jgi:hypothetical protein